MVDGNMEKTNLYSGITRLLWIIHLSLLEKQYLFNRQVARIKQKVISQGRLNEI